MKFKKPYYIVTTLIILLIFSFIIQVVIAPAHGASYEPKGVEDDSLMHKPYRFVGQVRDTRHNFSGSGSVARHPRIVITAAHYLFYQDSFANNEQIEWIPSNATEPYISPRDSSINTSYSDSYIDAYIQYGGNSKEAFNRDFIVLRFYENTIDIDSDQFSLWFDDGVTSLKSNTEKLIVGYPYYGLHGMHQIGPFNNVYVNYYHNVMKVNDVTAGQGASGGPIYVLDSENRWSFSGIHLGREVDLPNSYGLAMTTDEWSLVDQLVPITADEFSISTDNAFISGDGGSGSINVNSNITWEALPWSTYIHITSGSNGDGDGVIHFNVDPNPGPQRSVLITVRSTKSGINDQLLLDIVQGTASDPSISITSPSSGSLFSLTETIPLRWTNQGVVGSNVNIDISRDGGSTWSVLENSYSNTGSYNWTATGDASSNCRFKVTSTFDATIFSQSEIFAISALCAGHDFEVNTVRADKTSMSFNQSNTIKGSVINRGPNTDQANVKFTINGPDGYSCMKTGLTNNNSPNLSQQMEFTWPQGCSTPSIEGNYIATISALSIHGCDATPDNNQQSVSIYASSSGSPPTTLGYEFLTFWLDADNPEITQYGKNFQLNGVNTSTGIITLTIDGQIQNYNAYQSYQSNDNNHIWWISGYGNIPGPFIMLNVGYRNDSALFDNFEKIAFMGDIVEFLSSRDYDNSEVYGASIGSKAIFDLDSSPQGVYSKSGDALRVDTSSMSAGTHEFVIMTAHYASSTEYLTFGRVKVVNPSVTLNVVKGNEGQGNILINGTYCDLPCTRSFTAGSSVTIQAQAVDGYEFFKWGGVSLDNSVINPLPIFINENTNISVLFSPVSYYVAYHGNGQHTGATPSDINAYSQGDIVTVLGNSGDLDRSGYEFSGWNTQSDGSGTGFNPESSFAMPNHNVELYAQWTEKPRYSLSVTSSGASNVSISASPSTYGDTTNYNVLNIISDTSITLTAPKISEMAEFSHWSGCDTTTEKNCSLNMTSDKNVVVNYTIQHPIAYQPFPDTGQTLCYDRNDIEVSCDAIMPENSFYGQDRHYQPRMPRSYTKLGHGGVELNEDEPLEEDGGQWIMTRDNVTGLIWEVKSSSNKDDIYLLRNTQDLIDGLNDIEFGGISDWRIPSRGELSSLVNRGTFDQSINTDFFPNTISSLYWSSSKVASPTDYWWQVNFDDGQVLFGGGLYSHVRAVSGGKPSSSIFVDNLDGTVTDTTSNLMWQKCSYGQEWDSINKSCTGSPGTKNWGKALEAAETMTWAGYSDWRLPNINELQTLVEDTTYDPSIDSEFSQYTVSSGYWSSTTHASFTNRAWNVGFSYGGVNPGYGKFRNDNYVRAVRAGHPDDIELTRIIRLAGDLEFGNVNVGQSITRIMTLHNDGNNMITVSNISYPNGFSGNWSGGSIAAGSSRNVTVTFSPTEAKGYGSTITVSSNATSGINTITCSGTGVPAPDPVPPGTYYPFPDTGQSMCYGAFHNTVPCDYIQPGNPYYGQDSHYQPRLPRSYTKLGHGGVSLPYNALHVEDGGQWIMTRDNVTGLIWEIKTKANKKDVYHWGRKHDAWGEPKDVFYDKLISDSFGGFSDWRTPTVKELTTLINIDNETNPIVDSYWFPNIMLDGYFEGTDGGYWSSDIYVMDETYSWLVFFNNGSVNYASNSGQHYVIAVRGGISDPLPLVNNNDGTVTDPNTGLMWQQCNYGQTWDKNNQACLGNASTLNWQQALAYSEDLDWAGYSDWRLPNRNELQSILDYSESQPTVVPVLAKDTASSNYWSSTTRTESSDQAWQCDFNMGIVHTWWSKNSSKYVRAVRAGRSSIGEFGSLIINIEPAGAVAEGAQWKIEGTNIWRNSGYPLDNLQPDDYPIVLRDIVGWNTPDNRNISVGLGQTIETVHYTANTNKYQISVEPGTSGGSVSGSGTYQHNQIVTLRAEPDKRYEFLYWTINGQVVSTDQEYTFLANENMEILAHFEQLPSGLPGVLMLLLDDE